MARCAGAGLGDQFLQRVNETMTRIGPHQYPTIIEDVRRANLRQFKYGVWYRVKVDGSVVRGLSAPSAAA